MRISKGILSAVLALALTACGGGGSEQETPDLRSLDAALRDLHVPDTRELSDPVPEGDLNLSDTDLAAPDLSAPDLTAPDLPRDTTPPPTVEDLTALVDKARYTTDLEFIAKPRPPGSTHWQRVRDLCAQTFEENGFQVELHNFGKGVNVIGIKTGVDKPEEQVLISAHYDHVAACEGADDNASGTAGVLEAARVLGTADYSRTLVLACWDQEEPGLYGSAAYSDRAHDRGDRILVAFVFEMIGYSNSEPDTQYFPSGLETFFPEPLAWLDEHENRGDFLTIVNDIGSHEAAAALQTAAQTLGLPAVMLELDQEKLTNFLLYALHRSDHSSFWGNHYPAMMLTDTSEFRNDNYHCTGGPDSVETLDLDFATRIVAATISSAAQLLEPRAGVNPQPPL